MQTRQEKNKKIVSDIKKEKNIKRSKKMLVFLLIISIILILVYLYMYFIGTSFIQTHEYVIKNNNIPSSFHGTKIVHLSDLLYGTTIDKNDLDYLKKEISKINPDIIVFTGDLVYDKYQLTNNDLDILKDFFNNLDYRIGKFAVKGDMDSTTFDLVMEESKFQVLDNNYEIIYNNDNTPIIISGININNSNLFNINNSNNNYLISLIHNYDHYNNYNINANLVLAGHNLGGEIRLPFLGAMLGENKYVDNYYEENSNIVHISNGLGSYHKIRLFNHPSINVYRLYNN